MIAIDTNILVYSRREDSIHHKSALQLVKSLAEGENPWAIPWPCIYEFLRVVTHPRVFTPPSSLHETLDGLQSLLESPTLSLLSDGPAHQRHMIRVVHEGRATGNMVHDAHIAALVTEHGVTEFLTTDRDFSRFPGLPVRDPFA